MALLALASCQFRLQKVIFGCGARWPLPLALQPVLQGSLPELLFPEGKAAALKANFVVLTVIRSVFYLLVMQFCFQVPLYQAPILYVRCSKILGLQEVTTEQLQAGPCSRRCSFCTTRLNLSFEKNPAGNGTLRTLSPSSLRCHPDVVTDVRGEMFVPAANVTLRRCGQWCKYALCVTGSG